MGDYSDVVSVAQGLFEPIVIRYDGLDASKHRIDLLDFGKSAQGLAKIISTVATFVSTKNYVKDARGLECRTTIGVAEENCWSITAFIEEINNNPLAVAVTSGIFLILFQYVWNKVSGKEKEMELLHDALIKAIGELGRKDEQSRLLDTIDKMASGLTPAAKDAVRPIGRSCDTIRFGNIRKEYFSELDADDKAAICGELPEITEEHTHRVLISELDMLRATCKVSLIDDLESRYNAKITDPQAELPNNAYSIAMSRQHLITVRAKQKIYADGVRQFIISDTVEPSTQRDMYES